jgi:hypothetical protein
MKNNSWTWTWTININYSNSNWWIWTNRDWIQECGIGKKTIESTFTFIKLVLIFYIKKFQFFILNITSLYFFTSYSNFHTLTVWSPDPETIHLESYEKLIEETAASCPFKVETRAIVLQFHTLIVLSYEADNIN